MPLSLLLGQLKSPILSPQRLINMSRHASTKYTMAIRREDSSVWERRAPLAPADVRQLVKQDINVIVQPSNRRAYSMEVSIDFSSYSALVCNLSKLEMWLMAALLSLLKYMVQRFLYLFSFVWKNYHLQTTTCSCTRPVLSSQ